jgi:uncharacterized protein YecE (DUF72 family)
MKARQFITHEPSSPTYLRAKIKIEPNSFNRYGRFRPTPEVLEAWDRTAQFAHTLGATIVLFQCSASFQPTKDKVTNMREFFMGINRVGLGFAW